MGSFDIQSGIARNIRSCNTLFISEVFQLLKVSRTLRLVAIWRYLGLSTMPYTLASTYMHSKLYIVSNRLNFWIFAIDGVISCSRL